MIVSYKTKRTEAFASSERVREFSAFAQQAWKRLWLNLQTSYDLKIPFSQEGKAIERLPSWADHETNKHV